MLIRQATTLATPSKKVGRCSKALARKSRLAWWRPSAPDRPLVLCCSRHSTLCLLNLTVRRLGEYQRLGRTFTYSIYVVVSSACIAFYLKQSFLLLLSARLLKFPSLFQLLHLLYTTKYQLSSFIATNTSNYTLTPFRL